PLLFYTRNNWITYANFQTFLSKQLFVFCLTKSYISLSATSALCCELNSNTISRPSGPRPEPTSIPPCFLAMPIRTSSVLKSSNLNNILNSTPFTPHSSTDPSTYHHNY